MCATTSSSTWWRSSRRSRAEWGKISPSGEVKMKTPTCSRPQCTGLKTEPNHVGICVHTFSLSNGSRPGTGRLTSWQRQRKDMRKRRGTRFSCSGARVSPPPSTVHIENTPQRTGAHSRYRPLRASCESDTARAPEHRTRVTPSPPRRSLRGPGAPRGSGRSSASRARPRPAQDRPLQTARRWWALRA